MKKTTFNRFNVRTYVPTGSEYYANGVLKMT